MNNGVTQLERKGLWELVIPAKYENMKYFHKKRDDVLAETECFEDKIPLWQHVSLVD